MSLTPIILSLAAGIALHAGDSQLLIGFSRRPRDLTNIVFGAMTIALASHTLALTGSTQIQVDLLTLNSATRTFKLSGV